MKSWVPVVVVGSGFLISEDGEIATNAHVLEAIRSKPGASVEVR